VRSYEDDKLAKVRSASALVGELEGLQGALAVDAARESDDAAGATAAHAAATAARSTLEADALAAERAAAADVGGVQSALDEIRALCPVSPRTAVAAAGRRARSDRQGWDQAQAFHCGSLARTASLHSHPSPSRLLRTRSWWSLRSGR
jgi:hypothetical protein